MKLYIVLFVSAAAIILTTQATAWSLDEIREKQENTRSNLRSSLMGKEFSQRTNTSHSMNGNYQADAYGLGTNADQFGRSFNWQYRDGSTVSSIFNNDVKPDAYGLGVGVDPFGRPVHRKY